MPSLSDTTVRGAKPRERPYKLFDERGLYLLVTPTGGRLWRLKYRVHGREKLISLGAYPAINPLASTRSRLMAQAVLPLPLPTSRRSRTVRARN